MIPVIILLCGAFTLIWGAPFWFLARDERTDRQTNGRARPTLQPIKTAVQNLQ